MNPARIVNAGAIHAATEAGPGQLRLADGRVLAEEAVSWLPPLEPRTTPPTPSSGTAREPCAPPTSPTCTMNASWRWSSARRPAASRGARPMAMWPALRWPTPTRCAAPWRIGTAPTCASTAAARAPR
ncbi:hypothetical protein G6F40_016922 [Rhizopus arrhizus]|nr:hypothetical protein G6F40_016922 [Rhizopus arrhizus]